MVLIFGYKGPSGFSAKSTAEEVTAGINGNGLTAIITGPTSGIGQETARVLALRGVHVIMAVRNIDSGRIIKHAFSKEMPNAKVDVMVLDISSQVSVRKFASDFVSSGLPLNILILNAGTLAPPYTLSKDEIEMQFATNYLGHFLLTNLLLETMKKTARQSRIEGRVVSVSSELHKSSYMEGIRFDKINDKRSYQPMAAYGQSALAKVIHTTELARRFRQERVEITANSLHPGVIATNIGRHSTFMAVIFNGLLRNVLKSIPQGAATTCYLALNPQVKGVSGEYFADSNISVMSRQAKDPGMAKKLWDISISMTNSRWTARSRS